jgi:putative sugar O-methyltransferase
VFPKKRFAHVSTINVDDIEVPTGPDSEDRLHPALLDFLGNYSEFKAQANSGGHWAKFLEPVQPLLNNSDLVAWRASNIERYSRALSFGFEESLDSTSDIEQALELNSEISMAHDQITDHVNQRNGGLEHARALAVLEKFGELDNYRRMIQRHTLKSSMPTARHYYYSTLITEAIGNHGSGDSTRVLEIGAGAGNLAYFLSLSGRVAEYDIVDLPEMVICSGYTLSKYLPESNFAFGEYAAVDDRHLPTFRFSAPTQIKSYPEKHFDLILNFNSFAEMELSQVDDYFDEIYRVARDKSLFINVNRRNRILRSQSGDAIDNNPLLYPYRRSDDVIRWELDEFQTMMRSDFGKTGPPAFLHMARINK